MKLSVGTVVIERYQVEDFVNTLLSNNYIVELEKESSDKISIVIYKTYQDLVKIKEESEEN